MKFMGVTLSALEAAPSRAESITPMNLKSSRAAVAVAGMPEICEPVVDPCERRLAWSKPARI